MDEIGFEIISEEDFLERPKSHADEITKAYIAGLFDGEGHVGVDLRGNALKCVVTIANTNKECLEFVKSYYGGNFVEHNSEKTAWLWYLKGKGLETFAQDISPFSIIKRDQLELLLHARTLLVRPRSLISEELRAERQEVHRMMRELRKR